MKKKVKKTNLFKKSLLVLEIDNAPKINALDIDIIDNLIEEISTIKKNNLAKCLVIKGYKNSAFSSGADLKEIKNLSSKKKITIFNSKLNNLIKTFNNLPLPKVAIVNSYCFGAGFIVALCCDVIIASDQSEYCIPASKLGIKIHKFQLNHLKKNINNRFLKDILITGRKFSASEAYKFNIINHIYKEKISLDKIYKLYVSDILKNSSEINKYFINNLWTN